ncbi:uncharacterized protein [Argopecten irradians]|uniref:uncharacterized protein n=1 Tax=Argopecten irradians TaxID=31199 RepID=UPI00370F7AA5
MSRALVMSVFSNVFSEKQFIANNYKSNTNLADMNNATQVDKPCQLSIDNNGIPVCFWLIDTTHNANVSQAKCEDDDGTLAFIPNEGALTEIIGLITDHLNEGMVYFGYQKSATDEIVIQGTTIVHTWMEWDNSYSQPDSGRYEACIAIFTRTWKFHDADCSIEMYALCSTPYVLETTTDVSIITTTTGTATLSCCNCHIAFIITEVNITEELQEQLDTLKKETKVDEENLSSTIRKKTSASDPRPSSAYVGYLGITLLAVIFGGLFLLDLPRTSILLKKNC